MRLRTMAIRGGNAAAAGCVVAWKWVFKVSSQEKLLLLVVVVLLMPIIIDVVRGCKIKCC